MKKVFLISILFFSTVAMAGYTRGYYKQNGTYVEPYYRSTPDNNPYNNQGYYNSPNQQRYLDNYYRNQYGQ